MGTITRITGLSSFLLRAWERRYGLLRPERGPGGHRLYTDDDLDVLVRAQEMIREGRSIGEIAALGRETILASGRFADKAAPEPRVAGQSYELARRCTDIVQAAINLDADAINQMLDTVASAVTFPTLIQHVIEPAARKIGDLWKSGECTVASEHLASSIFVYRLRKLIESAESIQNKRSRFVIAACVPGEEHQLGILIVSYFLNRNGVRVLYLGGSLPFEDLGHACRASRPGAVLLSVTRAATFRKHRKGIVDLLTEVNHETLFYLGGGGSPQRDARLEGKGLRLAVKGQPAQEAVQRIVGDLAFVDRSD